MFFASPGFTILDLSKMDTIQTSLRFHFTCQETLRVARWSNWQGWQRYTTQGGTGSFGWVIVVGLDGETGKFWMVTFQFPCLFFHDTLD